MNEAYIKSIYEFIKGYDPDFAIDNPIDDFIEQISTDEGYAMEIYGIVTDYDDSFEEDVDQQSFINAVKKKRKMSFLLLQRKIWFPLHRSRWRWMDLWFLQKIKWLMKPYPKIKL